MESSRADTAGGRKSETFELKSPHVSSLLRLCSLGMFGRDTRTLRLQWLMSPRAPHPLPNQALQIKADSSSGGGDSRMLELRKLAAVAHLSHDDTRS